jgi:predicted TIM-barrel enzyme
MNIKPRLFVVVHTVNPAHYGLDHAKSQACIARESGADGVCIIPDYEKGDSVQATTADQVVYLEALKKEFPDFPIGVNFLKNLRDNPSVVRYLYHIQPAFMQTDSTTMGGVDKRQLSETEFFCGVAFKYSSNESLRGIALRDHCIEVSARCEVPTTSGTATGVPADIDKIQEIKACLPDGKRLGIASGVTIDNVAAYMRAGVTDCLVATSLRAEIDDQKRDILDPAKVIALAHAIHNSVSETDAAVV